SPPRLTATQLPSATRSQTFLGEDFHLADTTTSQAHPCPRLCVGMRATVKHAHAKPRHGTRRFAGPILSPRPHHEEVERAVSLPLYLLLVTPYSKPTTRPHNPLSASIPARRL